MTSSHQAPALWSELLLRSLAEVRELFSRLEDELGPASGDDFAHLLEGGSRLKRMLDSDAEQPSSHDLMNVLAAIRGYAEMLLEDIGELIPELAAALERLLKAVQGANDSGQESAADNGQPRNITSEPGFILAVDDLQENRELVARYLSRSGHIVVTAAGGEEALSTL